MAFSTYIGVTPVSVPLDSTAVGKFLRVKRGSNGLYTLQDASARGEYVTLNDGAASEVVEGAALGTPARVPFVVTFSAAIAPGTVAYTGANGTATDSNASGIILGKFADTATVTGQFARVDLLTVL